MAKRPPASADGAPAKRQKKRHFNSVVDPGSGQRYAFTGYGRQTTIPDTDLEFEDDSEAIAYLNAVRQEADAIPQLLVADKPATITLKDSGDDHVDRSIYDDGIGDSRGYFDDGAYIAAPVAGESDSDYDNDPDYVDDENDDSADAKHARIHRLRKTYYQSLVARFETLRKVLHATPPAAAVAALPSTHSYQVGRFGPKSATFNTWSDRLRSTDPMPAQVASMSKDGVLRVLRIALGGQFLRRGHEVRERTTRWLWALLARLPDRGSLDHVEIGWVRELGRRAVLLATNVADMAELRYQVDRRGGDLGVHDAVDEPSDGEEKGDDDVKDDGGESGDAGDMAELEVDGVDVSGSDDSDSSGSSGEKEQQKGGANAEGGPERDTESRDGEPMDLSDGEIGCGRSEGDGDGGRDDTTNMLDEIQAAKARLMRQLEGEGDADHVPTDEADSLPDDSLEYTAALSPADANLYATINMILTVVGEMYGQRDLLEFRHPFPQVGRAEV